MYAVVRLRRGSGIANDLPSEDLIFDKQLYLGKYFGRLPDVELEMARKSGSPGANRCNTALALHGFSRNFAINDAYES